MLLETTVPRERKEKEVKGELRLKKIEMKLKLKSKLKLDVWLEKGRSEFQWVVILRAL